MRLPRYVLPAAALVAALALPATAGASIVPQQGMLGVKLGMTGAQIQARLGPPDRVRHPSGEITGRFTEYRYGEVVVSLFDGSTGQVFNFFTKGKSARTVKGVGVGSPESYVRSAVRGVTCKTEFGSRHCFLGQFLAGRTVTDFRISKAGRVSSVTVGRVID
jgi:hypothetical protein